MGNIRVQRKLNLFPIEICCNDDLSRSFCVPTLREISGLQEIDCGGCTSLTSLPEIAGLKTLWCQGCSLLYIPVTLRHLLKTNVKSRHSGKRLRRIARNVRYNVATRKGLKMFVNERILSSMDRSRKVFDNLTFHILCRYVFEM